MCDAFIRIDQANGETQYIVPRTAIIRSPTLAYVWDMDENTSLTLTDPGQIILLRQIMDRRALEEDRIPPPPYANFTQPPSAAALARDHAAMNVLRDWPAWTFAKTTQGGVQGYGVWAGAPPELIGFDQDPALALLEALASLEE